MFVHNTDFMLNKIKANNVLTNNK